jgi:hypothetical protein
VKKRSGLYPRLAVDASGRKVVSRAGGVLLTRTAAAVGLDAALSAALAPWRRPLARHDPGKIVLDLAISLAVGGDCLADIAQLRAHPQVFGAVASDPMVSRCLDALAADSTAALAAIDTARATARARAWAAAGEHAPTPRSTPLGHWSSTSTPPWSPPTRRRSPRRRRSSAASTFIRCGRSATTVPRAPANPSPCSCGPASRLQHRHRPHRGDSHRTRPAARQPPAGQERAEPHRRRRWHPRADRLADPPPVVILDRLHPARRPDLDSADLGEHSGAGVDPGLRRRRPGPRRRLGRRADRRLRPLRLAGRHAADRVPGTPAPRRPAADHRRRRAPDHRVSSPTAGRVSSPTWSCGTAAGPAPKTGSGLRRTAGWPTCRCTTTTRTRSGAPSWRWPATWSPGCRPWP